MNIHFTDRELFKKLTDATLIKVKVGSHMYNLDDKHSDTDYLCIYVPSISERNSFSFTHHQFQYKEDNIDYNFVNIHNFIRNAINGDSTINFEVINSEQIGNSPIWFLYYMREAFNNYMIIRSYLGLAKRDLKQISSTQLYRDKDKKISHALRGYYFAKSIVEGKFRNILNPIEYKEVSDIKTSKSVSNYETMHSVAQSISERLETLREFINSELDKGTITRFMKVEDQNKLDGYLSELFKSPDYIKKGQFEIDMNMIYQANENGVKY